MDAPLGSDTRAGSVAQLKVAALFIEGCLARRSLSAIKMRAAPRGRIRPRVRQAPNLLALS